LGAGLWLITAPYCHRCQRLRGQLDSLRPRVAYEAIDATERPDLVRTLAIRSAPTLLAIDSDGHLQGRLEGDYTEDALAHIVTLSRQPGKPHRTGGE